jgi:hypothetical protein
MYDSNQQGAEMHEGAAHAHTVAEQHGKGEHLTGHESSRQSLEHIPRDESQHNRAVTVGHGIAAFGHDDIAALAHELWQGRGCPNGSPQEDWFHAVEDLRARAFST